MNNDRYHIKENAEFLKDLGKKYGNVLNRTTMINFVNDAKEKSSISTSVNFGIMVKYLVDVLGLFEEIRIYPDNKEPIIRYVAKYIPVSPYEIALSLKSKSFLSHYSALYVHDLTINNPKEIYINTEQTLKPRNEANSKLTQGKIDFAFSKPMRKTKTTFLFRYNGIMYTVFVLNSKNTRNTGIIKKETFEFSKAINVTNLERTLIDVTVRPTYSGGSSEILEAYKLASLLIDINRMELYLKKFDYIYPYEKSIFLYIQYIGNSVLFENLYKAWYKRIDDNLNFYLDYQIADSKLDTNLNIYYPKTFDIQGVLLQSFK